ncbi:MAG TPA: glycosyltransferase family 2 protein [Abditibacterium sp.]|jgi:GT2 family glycosyltransferase
MTIPQESSPTDSAPTSASTAAQILPQAPAVAAIVVTRNRLALLQECLAALRAQTRRPDEILVIDNASDDGTREYLNAQTDLVVIHQGNVGGAGGFHRGIKEAYGRGHDWFWCMDDDTIPAPDALETLSAAPSFADKSAGYLGSVVRWTDGALHKMNMVGGHDKGYDWYNTVLGDKCVPSSISTFVSILINRRAVAKVGLPIKEFFIWSDDVEYTHRVSRVFPCFHVLDSVALHKTPFNKDGGVAGLEPHEFWKLRYGLRNQVTFLRRQQGLSLRGLRVAYFIARNIFFIVKARAPLSLIKNLLSGLWFNPRIERVAPDKAL